MNNPNPGQAGESEEDETPDVPLSIASLRANQPERSRFILEENSEGVTLTEPPGKLGNTATEIAIGVLLVAAVPFLFIFSNKHGSIAGLLCLLSTVIIAGVMLTIDGWRKRGMPLTIEVRAGRLILTDPTRITNIRREWSSNKIEKISVSASLVDLVMTLPEPDSLSPPPEQAICRLSISTGWGLPEEILTGRYRDECEWISRVLESALDMSER